MKSRRFTTEDQIAFAELSGDYNPLHMDALAARRMMYGAPVVHGIHLLLWGLDAFCEERREPMQLRKIRSAFVKPLRVGEEAHVLLTVEDGWMRIEIVSGDAMVTKVECQWEPSATSTSEFPDTPLPEHRPAVARSLDEIEGRSGGVELSLNRAAAHKLFPHLTKFMPPLQMAILLGTTRLVGVECPGLHSVFSELNLSVGGPQEKTVLQYEVTKLDRRFGLILMNVFAPGLAGVIKAFVRPLPLEQPGYAKLKSLVTAGEFTGQQALVIGGSRGLGEVTAKLLAAGGAGVLITYHRGQAEAQRVVDEINTRGGAADDVQVDVLAPQQIALTRSLVDFRPTHLYFFATPFIFSGNKGVFSLNLFQKFCDYYVAGFLNVMHALKDSGVNKVFHPSSVAVDELPPDMAEYAVAKMAAETLCAHLEKARNASLKIYHPRLPRMGTDQTVSLLPVNNQDPAPIMLEHLRTLRDM